MPMIMPCRRRSKGMAASSTTSSVAAAPLARKPGAQPFDQMVGGDVVGRDDDYAAATPGTNPVLRQRHRLGGARAGGVDLRVGTARADEFGELRMSHGQDSEQEPPVEDIRLFLDGGAQLVDAPVDLLHKIGMPFASSARRAGFPAWPTARGGLVRVVARHFIGKRIVAREGRSKNHAGVVAHRVRQPPAIRQLRALGGGLITHDQRDAGVTQRVDARRDRQPGNAVESGHAIGGNAKFIFQIESASAARQLDDVRDIVMDLKRGSAVLAFHQARDVFVEHGLAETRGDRIDELIATQDAANVAVVEDVLGSGQAQRRAGDHHRDAGRSAVLAVVDLQPRSRTSANKWPSSL